MVRSSGIPVDYAVPAYAYRKVVRFQRTRKWIKRVFVTLLLVYFVGGLWMTVSMNYAVIQYIPDREFFPVCVVIAPNYRAPKPDEDL